ncbi:MAG: carboxyl transferase domain-containing protein, partial [Planctomycetota bacterium]|nr:carboxyl transferase domain-containing protein [Planctomycetota bacterium]
MKQYFEKMPSTFGKMLEETEIKRMQENFQQIKDEDKKIAEAIETVRKAGLSTETLHQRGEKTVHERIELLVDPGTFLPLNTLYNPANNEEGTTGVVNGIGKIAGKYASIIASDNKVLAGAWIPGQAENIFRAQDIAERLNIPLVWVLNCSGVKLTQQEEVYAGRRGHGRPFFRHAELEQKGIPVLVAIFGTNPAGGGYHGISPTMLFAHKNANIAVGGAGIVSGMSPKGGFDLAGAEQIIEATRKFKSTPPGGIKTHFDHTGFFKSVFETEETAINALRDAMKMMPVYNPGFFRVSESKPPLYPPNEIDYIVHFNQKRSYDVEQVMARIFDNSEHTEYRPGYGPEVYCGLAKLDGFLVGVIGNRQGFLPKGYPKYAPYPGVGGKLYREGLIKMNELVTACGRDRIPMVWLQDTSGIDVGDIAEKAELLGLGQALIYSIQQSDLPMATVILRKGTAAAHYIMGGPQATSNNAFTLGTPTTEIYVMHGETAAAASFSRRLVKEKDAGKPLEPVIDAMNKLAKQYYDQSRPVYCAQRGYVDEVVSFAQLRNYFTAFADACYQNP